MRRVFALIMMLALSAMTTPRFTAYAQSSPSEGASASTRARFVAGEIIIRFKAHASENMRSGVRRLLGAALRRRIEIPAIYTGRGELELAALPANLLVGEAIALLRNHPDIEFVEPNWIYTHQAVSNDPFYTNGSLWGMYGDQTTPANQYGSQAGEAWAAGQTGSSTVYVGVIDEGIDINHPDLQANIWTNQFDPVDGVDNDGNGYIDDTHGYDFANNNNSVYDGTPGDNDTDAHGTHVSGTIGGVGGNGIGVAGVNWNVTIISGKFLNPNGGTTADAIEAVNYFTDLKTRHGLNIVATNNSWGGGGYAQSLHDAIIRGAKAGILFMAAAGNGNAFGQGVNNDTTARYPCNYNTAQGTTTESAASYDAVISVASITSTGAKSSFSNYGATTVDLGAPGSGINSTTPNNTYSSFSGTSMATPHVSGAAALYLSINPGATPQQIRAAILDSASSTPTSSLSGITVTGGRLNVSLFITTPPPSPPSAPTNLTATAASSSQINLAWTDTSNSEDGFKIERCQGAGCTNFTQVTQTGANATTYNDTGLSASTTYSYRVRAFNAGGDSGYSNTASATTQASAQPPAAPSGLTATAVSTSQINLAWTDNAGNETGFRIERCQGQGCTSFTQIAQVGANVRSFSNTGLSRNTRYRYRVRAYNAAGNSAYSNTANARTRR